MKASISRMFVAAILAATVIGQAAAHSKSIVVVPSSALPEMTQRHSEAMYLDYTADGRAVLYLEQDQGRTLAVVDVSDPAAIRPVAQVSIAAPSPFDFVEALRDSAVLIRYRDQSGFAVIDFKKFKTPVLTEAPQFQHQADAETIGHDGLLVASPSHPSSQAEDPQYDVFDISNASKPAELATVKGVRHRLERTDTGTLFLLGDTGLTVIRQPEVEQEYKIESTYTN